MIKLKKLGICTILACLVSATLPVSIFAVGEEEGSVDEGVEVVVESENDVEAIVEEEDETETIIEEEDETETIIEEGDNHDHEEDLSHGLETECTLNHDHTTEICDVPFHGTFLNWSTIPSVWEYNYDNSDACWNWGMWSEGFQYTTPTNEYDIDVRNKITVYTDGEYIYMDVIHATVLGNDLRKATLTFTVDGNPTEFQVVLPDGNDIHHVKDSPGVYDVMVNHAEGAISGEEAIGSDAVLYVKETGYNHEYEVKIPLTELQRQNPDINLETLNEIVFTTEAVLTYRPIVVSGISTFPYILAAVCMAVVGFGVYKIHRRRTN